MNRQRWTILLALLWVGMVAGGCGNHPRGYPYQVESLYGVEDPQFLRTMGTLLGPGVEGGNQLTTLVNGDQIFPAMLQAIREAKSTICFETFIYWSGEIAEEFTEALSERARAGVRVNCIIDAVGGMKMKRDYLQRMKEAGVRFVHYHPLRWFDIGSAVRLNNRTHRKVLVVDGRIGFTGGVGIADEWRGNAQSPKHWRDTHYRIEGPAVAHLQAAFMDNWIETVGHVLHGEEYFPEVAPAGRQWVQVFKSSSQDGGSENMQVMHLLSMAAARKRILLGSAYFIPDEPTTKVLLAARQRGVEVRVLVPGRHMDVKMVRDASRARWGPLLKAGIEIHEYAPTMYHCKLMVVDDLWTSIGSANLDNRSFRLNDEVNMNVFDATFAAEQARLFEEDLGRSKRITFEQWKKRPLWERMKERFASLLGSQL